MANELGLTNIIKLASNENPLGCSSAVKEALTQLSPHQLATYAIPLHHPLRKKLARRLNVDLDMVTLTSGSEAIIPIIQMCFALHSDRHILSPTLFFYFLQHSCEHTRHSFFFNSSTTQLASRH